MNLFITFCIFTCFNIVYCSVCNTHKTCSKCIGHGFDKCVWCAQESHYDLPRCQPESILSNKTWCKKDNIYNPESSKESSHDTFRSDVGKEVQFIPRKINIKLRPGVPVDFEMKYKPANGFPIDLYFLMDFSASMEPFKKKLVDQANKIFANLRKISNDVRFGVGSFIDKPSFPYTDTKLLNTYSFKNHLSLTNNTATFFEKMNLTKKDFGANYDDPEGCLDALIQVMLCETQIDWRSGSRRIILISTDGTYHSAGDGKFVGAFKPHDMKCHLENNEYQNVTATKLDYPSVSLINKVTTDNNFKIIFVSEKGVAEDYVALVRHISNANYVELNENSNIFKIIEKVYQESVRTVKLNYELPEFVQLKLNQECDVTPKVNCESTPGAEVVTIPATVKVMKCIDEDVSIKINPFGLKDTLELVLNVDCKCSCESDYKPLSINCSNSGFKQCGACICNADKSGDVCQFDCSAEKASQYSDKCKQSTDDVKFCNGRGVCRCGKCETCDEGFSGEFCQFNDKACRRKNGLLCAGNGVCRYGKCQCHDGWKGEDCSCPKKNNACIGPFSSKECSGSGKCVCGVCECHSEHYGVYCDVCEECSQERCKELEDFAYCNRIKSTEECETEFNQTNVIVKFLNKTEMESPKWVNANKCEKILDDGHLFIFKYQFLEESRRLRLLIQKELDEPSSTNVWLAAGISIGLVILIGIITLIVWKILIDMYDKREYEKFCQEAEAEGYNTTLNPLYESMEVNFVNPTYNGGESN